jgi:hypothetical protein
MAYPDTRNRYKSSIIEPEFGRLVSRSAHWQEENARPQQERQSRRIKSQKRNTDNSIDRKIKDNDIGMMVRYVDPRFNGENSPAFYNGEEMDGVVTYMHARPTHDGPQHVCPYCRNAQYVRHNPQSDPEPDNYYPYHRFAPRSETAVRAIPHKPAPLGYQAAGYLPSGYKSAGTQTKHRPSLQNMSEEDTMIVSAEQKLKGFVAMETAEQEGNGETIDAKGEGEKHARILGSHGDSVEEMAESVSWSVEDETAYSEDSVDDEVSAEMNSQNITPTFHLHPVLPNLE